MNKLINTNWLKNLSAVYVLSLPERTEDRLLPLKKEFKEHGIFPLVWCAAKRENGAEGLKETFRQLFSFWKYSIHRPLMICEDDCVFLQPLDKIMDKVFEQLPTDFDLLHLGANLLMPPTRYSETLLSIKAAYAAHCVIYSPSAVKKILPLLEEKPEPFDVILAKYIHPQGKSYCTYPMLATQRATKSDIDSYSKEKCGKYWDENLQTLNIDFLLKDRFENFTKNI